MNGDRVRWFLLVSLAVTGILGAAAALFSPRADAYARSTKAVPGRYAVIDTYAGVFLADSATGRVFRWDGTRWVITDNQVLQFED